MTKGEKKEKKMMTEISRDYTVNLHKRLQKTTFKKKAPKALKQIREFASKAMNTQDVRIDTTLNQFLWATGIRNIPRRVRIRVQRKKNDSEDAKHKFYSFVTHIPVESFKGLMTEVAKQKKQVQNQ